MGSGVSSADNVGFLVVRAGWFGPRGLGHVLVNVHHGEGIGFCSGATFCLRIAKSRASRRTALSSA